MSQTLLCQISRGWLYKVAFSWMLQFAAFLWSSCNGDIVRFHGGNRVRGVFDLLGNSRVREYFFACHFVLMQLFIPYLPIPLVWRYAQISALRG
jgi:hypothetical protein